MKFLKVGLVVFGALVLTTLGISASDVFSNSAGSLLGQLTESSERSCPVGMGEVVVGQTFSCVDLYEVSPGENCPVRSPQSKKETQNNLNTLKCMAESRADVQPWTYVTRSQAQALCARAGKRLPTSAEWFVIAAGTLDTEGVCNTNTGTAADTGEYEQCISGVQAYDTVGNVWEWVADDVVDGMFAGRVLPEEGYVGQVDTSGVAVYTTVRPSDEFGADYFWSESEGIYSVLRGGFYGSGEDAGVYAVHSRTLPTAATVAIGFRCVQ